MSRDTSTRPLMGLGFATAASFAELAPIVELLRQGATLPLILAAGLAYQTGGAAARWVPGRGPGWLMVAILAVACLVFAKPGEPSWYASLAALAWSLQAARRRHAHARPADSPTTARKRAARVLGFLAASLAPLWASLAIILAAVALAAGMRLGPANEPRPRLSGHPIEAVMVLHQTHYFTYCYGLLLILSQLAGGPGLVGLWFGVGWVTYLSAERLWARTRLDRALVLGHIVVAATLMGLALLGRDAMGAVAFWTLTGFGGGTVYCLTRLHRSAAAPAEALDLAEDIGHAGGVAIALLLVLVAGLDAQALAGVGAFFALATIIAFLGVRPRLAASPSGGL